MQRRTTGACTREKSHRLRTSKGKSEKAFTLSCRYELAIDGDQGFTQWSKQKLQRREAIAQQVIHKFGRYACLTPFFPAPIVDWEAKWYIRGVSHPAASLIA